jgi:ATP-dependent DNA helicase RecG
MKYHDMIHAPEGKTLEFKQDLSSPQPVLKTMIAFANTAGGRLVIGVTENRQIIGVADPLKEEERLCSLIADTIAPRLVPNIEMVTVDNKTLLIADVFLSNSRPHYLIKKGVDQGVYVRLGSTNRQADPDLIAELRRSVEGVAFDEMPLPDLTLDDLDARAMADCFGKSNPPGERELKTLKLLVPHQGRLVPFKGAVLLFGRERTLHFSDAWVQCGRFVGTRKTDIFDHIEIDDPMPMAVDSIMLFLKKHAMRGADISGIRRKDVWSIPLDILREAVINALVHADYSQRGAPVRISFFDDRIEIENPGILLPGMTVEDMKQGVSRIRNPVIARVFRELNLVEQWGIGVPRIFQQALELGLPEPEILEIGMRLRFIVGLGTSVPVTPSGSKGQAQGKAQEPAQVEAQDQAQVGAQVDHQILTACAENPMSSAEIAAALGHRQLSGNLRKALPRLREAGLLAFTVPDHPKSRWQKYRLTDKGRQWIDVRKKPQDSGRGKQHE